nr:ribonuclease H-like domain-containing protein [Tanacetum cinerariifolium]
MKDIAITELRRKLDLAQKEKDNMQRTVDKLENASKSLNKLIDCQIVDNCKKGLGYDNYNGVPPPYTGNFMPPKPDLSFTGLDEFANKPIVKNCDAKTSETKPKDIKKNNDALIIKEWVSDDEEEEVTQPKIEQKIVKPSIPKIEFVKPKPIHKKTTFDNSNVNQKVNTVRSKTANTAIPKVVVNVIQDYEEFNGGYVAFGGNLKGGKITSKRTIRTDHLGKFDGKADEGLFVGYLLSSKSFRVFNSRKKIVEENLHIRFSENTPNVVGSRPDWLFDIDTLTRTMNYEPIHAGTQYNGFADTKACDNVGQDRKEKEPVKYYILLPLWTTDPPFSQDPKSSQDDGFQPSSDSGKKVDEGLSKGSECRHQD